MDVCSGSGVGSGGGEGARSKILFLPPITPRPFLGFFGGSMAAVSGTAGLGGGEGVGVRLRGEGEISCSGSGSASDSVAVASFTGTAWGCGDRLFFLGVGLGGEMAGLVSFTLCRGTTSCCWGFSEFRCFQCYRRIEIFEHTSNSSISLPEAVSSPSRSTSPCESFGLLLG